ncbi:hypothetical protein EBE87_27045 [Pseudoroseomonas wenyumeiae]|uniref:Transposase DDE domain-containing protein n=1 Tax=Teichococcus wenyumeiae TaxID=2478470 RepID=A0A3A9J868_9PROT|nr:hypothetical protein D6Z83_23190 [Pseudoroseomonas wenyumeiae]RMI15156.1 hypothetical protein EBE87_27045 [Pseudoroseomonas wenyumeiae]
MTVPRLRADARQHRRHQHALPRLRAVTAPKRLIADQAYDAESLRRWLKERRIKAVIPSTVTRTKPSPLHRQAYRRRNQIERLFCRLKNWRRPATRYDRSPRTILPHSR